MEMNEHNIVFLMLIAGRTSKDALLNMLSESGGRLIKVAYGRGCAKTGHLMDALGFIPEENKVLITCLLPNDKSDAIMETLNRKFNFDKPNTGIGFTIPIEKLTF